MELRALLKRGKEFLIKVFAGLFKMAEKVFQ
jgi:hypothetical protein